MNTAASLDVLIHHFNALRIRVGDQPGTEVARSNGGAGETTIGIMPEPSPKTYMLGWRKAGLFLYHGTNRIEARRCLERLTERAGHLAAVANLMASSHRTTEPQPAVDNERPSAFGGRPGIAHDLFCQICGYNLRGLTGDRCPECGHSLETVRSTVPQIPWVHRDQLGRFRAYWRTVWLVMFRQSRFCEEMARPVSYADAQRFRWVTILHMHVPLLLATAGWYVGAWPTLFDDPLANQLFRQIWPAVGLHMCIALFLAAVTGVPSYFFHPRNLPTEMQNRAIAVSHYACSPLALAALPIAPGAFFIWSTGASGLSDKLLIGSFLLTVLLLAALMYAWLAELFRISRRVMPQYRGRSYLIVLGVPASWALLGLLIFGIIPLTLFFIVIVFASLG